MISPSLPARLAILVAVVLSAVAAYAADDYSWSGDRGTGRAAAYPPEYPSNYTSTAPLDEELLVRVSVWGEVARAGFYEVPDGTNAVQLISYAGGPTEYANLKHVRVTRAGEMPAGDVDVRAYLNTGDLNAVPVLKPGDTIFVPKNQRYAWTTFVAVMSQLAVVAGTVMLYVEVSRKN
jgi:protein involved in polysaccharide export with SLBB domain